MAKTVKSRIVLTFVAMVAVFLAASLLTFGFAEGKLIQAEAQTVAPDGWQAWESWNCTESDVDLDYFEGSGTNASPKKITTAEDLAKLCSYVNGGGDTTNIEFKLGANIDLGGKLFTPIGTSANPFNGKFRGANYVIKNIYMVIDDEATDDIYAGLFGYLGEDSIVTQVGLMNGVIKNTLETNMGIGALAGYLKGGQVSEVYSTVNIISLGGKYVGGLVGQFCGSIQDVYTNSEVKGIDTVGGVVGFANVELIGSHNSRATLNSALALGTTSFATPTDFSPAPDELFTEFLGGVAGNVKYVSGDSNSSASLMYCYFNSTKNPGAYGIGARNGEADSAYSDTSAYKGGQGWTEDKLSSSEVTKYSFNKNRWTTSTKCADGSAKYGLTLTNLSTGNNNSNMSYSLEASIMRIYGFIDGSGEWGKTADNPYIIYTVEQFQHLATQVNGGQQYEDTYFAIGDDLDFTGVEYAPIGVFGQAINRPFKGTLDGGYHTIDNISLDRTLATDGKENYVGIFGYIEGGGTVKNLTIGSGCTIKGSKYVGALAGRADGTITHIISNATVVGGSDSAGLVGVTSGGNFSHIISKGKVSSMAGSAGVLYGIIGDSKGLKAMTNCWYLVSSKSVFKSTNGWGSTMIIDSNGSVEVNMNALGQITFSGAGAAGWTTEFRDVAENVLTAKGADTDKYIADIKNNVAITVYARFVKELVVESATGVETVVGTGNYYQGQNVTIKVKVQDGYFMSNIMAGNSSGQSAVEATYQFSEGSGVMVSFPMTGTYTVAYPEIKSIDAPSIADRTYNGVATAYTHTVEGFDITYSWSEGYAPKNANEGASEPYTVSVIVRKDNVQRGKQDVPFRILKKQIVIEEADINLVKEYDGKEYDGTESTFISTTIEQPTDQIVAGDSVLVTCKVAFLQVIPTVEGSTQGAPGYARFDLTGPAKDNYYITSTMSASVGNGWSFTTGRIDKRTITVTIESKYLSHTYDGSASAIAYYGIVNQLDGADAQLKLKFYLLSDETKTPCPAKDVGEYGILPYTENHDVESIYIFKLADDYVFTINPLKVAINILNVDEFVYDDTTKNAAAKYTNEYSLTSSIAATDTGFTYYRKVGGDYVEDSEHKLAGDYKVVAVISGNYAVDTTKTDIENGINEAYFTIEKATSPEIVLHVSEGPYAYGGADVALSYTGGSSETSGITYVVNSGFGTINGDKLVLDGGGEIKVVVKKATSDNYKEGVSEEVILNVSKPTIDITLNDFSIDYFVDIDFPFVFTGFVQKDLDAGVTVPAGFALPDIEINGELWSSGTYYDASEIAYNVVVGTNATSNGYIFNYVNLDPTSPKHMTVNKRSVDVKADAKTISYGDFDDDLTYTVWDGDEQLEVTLNGSLEREAGKNADVYQIGQGTITDQTNPNFIITYIGNTYEITPLTLVITMTAGSKNYGEEDPEPEYTVTGYAYGERWADAILSGSITRRKGEDAFTAKEDYGYYTYLSTELKVSQNYELKFTTANLYIYPAEPTFSKADISFEIEYGDALKEITPIISLEKNLEGYFEWKYPDLVPDFTQSDTIEFPATFIPGNRNYKSVTASLVVTVIPREVEINFIGDAELTYNGKEQKTMTYELGNVLFGDNLHETITFEGDFVEVGVYTVRVSINNMSYNIVGDDYIVVKILPAPLTIYIEDENILEGEKPNAKIVYEGFVNGEDANSLTSQAKLDLPTMAGNYTVKPYGVEASNYKAIYKAATFRILKPELKVEDRGITLTGNFDAFSVLTFNEIKASNDSEVFVKYSDEFDATKADYGIGEKVALSMLFEFGVSANGEEQSVAGSKVSLKVPTRLRESKQLVVMFILEDGTIKYADDVYSKSGVLYFTAVDCKYVAIACPPDYTWVVLVVVIVVLVAASFIIDAVTEKMGVGLHSAAAKAKRAARKAAKKGLQAPENQEVQTEYENN